MDRELARALALFDREVGPLMPAPRRVASNIAPARRGANDRAHHARSAAPANARSAVLANEKFVAISTPAAHGVNASTATTTPACTNLIFVKCMHHVKIEKRG